MSEQESQAAALQAYFDREPPAAHVTRPISIYRAVPGPYLASFGAAARLECIQSNKPLADALRHAGHEPTTEGSGCPVDLAIVFATKHREEVLSHLALAAERLEEGGVLMVAAANTLGATSLERRCAELLGNVESFSKHKCRVLRAVRRAKTLNADLLNAWREAGALQRVPATGFYASPGIFSWKSLDPGSRLLAAQLPTDLRGRGADLGAGYGYLSRMALERAPGITELQIFEAEHKALDAARLNLAELRSPANVAFHWSDVTAGLGLTGLDFVIMNPPFHAGRGALPALGRAFVRAALEALRPGGRLFMVANRHLPYETEIQAMSASVETALQDNGYKIIVARKI